jgi:uncharacterized protein YbaR (Trm112 family)
MEMGSKEGISRIKPESELYTCPGCNYTDGFHVAFQKMDNSKEWEVVLICPQCHRRYAIHWKINLEEK